MLPSGAGSSSGNRPCSCTVVSGWLAASRAASTMRLIRIGSIGTRSWVNGWKRSGSPFLRGREGCGGSRLPAAAWQKRRAGKTRPRPGLHLEGEGNAPSCIVVRRIRAIVPVELARKLQRGGVAFAGGQRLEVDRPQRDFLDDLHQAFLGEFEDGQEGDH